MRPSVTRLGLHAAAPSAVGASAAAAAAAAAVTAGTTASAGIGSTSIAAAAAARAGWMPAQGGGGTAAAAPVIPSVMSVRQARGGDAGEATAPSEPREGGSRADEWHVDSQGHMALVTATSSSEPWRWSRIRRAPLRLASGIVAYLLPAGYPSTVAPSYAAYASWTAAAMLFSTLTGVLSMQSLLYAVGLGAGAIPLAAALNWILKDGLGQLGGVLYTAFVNTRFDADPKRWRFIAAVTQDASSLLEILTPLVPAAFLPLAALANVGKNVSWLSASATRAAIHQSLAVHGNLADVTGKAGSQTVAASTAGTIIGIGLSAALGSNPLNLVIAFAAFAAAHQFCMYQALSRVVLPTLNDQRLVLALTPTMAALLGEGAGATRLAAATAAADPDDDDGVAAAKMGRGGGGGGGDAAVTAVPAELEGASGALHSLRLAAAIAGGTGWAASSSASHAAAGEGGVAVRLLPGPAGAGAGTGGGGERVLSPAMVARAESFAPWSLGWQRFRSVWRPTVRGGGIIPRLTITMSPLLSSSPGLRAAAESGLLARAMTACDTASSHYVIAIPRGVGGVGAGTGAQSPVLGVCLWLTQPATWRDVITGYMHALYVAQAAAAAPATAAGDMEALVAGRAFVVAVADRALQDLEEAGWWVGQPLLEHDPQRRLHLKAGSG